MALHFCCFWDGCRGGLPRRRRWFGDDGLEKILNGEHVMRCVFISRGIGDWGNNYEVGYYKLSDWGEIAFSGTASLMRDATDGTPMAVIT